MIIGRGMLAQAFSAFENEQNIVIFASGVSDSQEVREDEFEREKNLLLNTIKMHGASTFVYFSTCSMHDPMAADTAYVKHKLAMEEIIKELCANYYIFRISQIVGWTKNNKTLTHFLINKINAGTTFDVWERSTRNLIDIEDVQKLVIYIINHKIYLNQTIHIANKCNIPILQLIQTVEEVLKKKAHYSLVNKGAPYTPIDLHSIENLLIKLSIDFDEDYIARIVRKYYDPQKALYETSLA